MAPWDRPHKKIVDEAPPQFAALADLALSLTDARIATLRETNSVRQQDMRAAVVAALAIASHRQLGTWSARALSEATRRGDFSISQLPPRLRAEVKALFDEAWTFRFLLHPDPDG